MADKKCADQTAHMYRLVCAFVVLIRFSCIEEFNTVKCKIRIFTVCLVIFFIPIIKI